MSLEHVLSPLALTQVLPFLPLSQSSVDYEVSRRDDPGLIEELLVSTKTKILLISGGTVAVPRGQGAVARRQSVTLRAAMLPAPYMRDFITVARQKKSACVVFLGSRDGTAYLSLSVPALPADSATAQPPAPIVGASTLEQLPPDSFLARVRSRFDWVDLRDFAPHASALEAGLATSAVTVSGWHATQRFCPQCGAKVEPTHAGWAQLCTDPEHHAVLFPRIEPAVITSVVDRDDRLLLQHNYAWKHPKLVSVSAGFVEAGESLEHAVRRETMEEVGIQLGDVTYMGSQPWPFQRSLMVAFKARALTTDIHVDGVEVERAQWMSRDDFMRGLAADEFELPTKAAVARYQIQEWFGRDLG